MAYFDAMYDRLFNCTVVYNTPTGARRHFRAKTIAPAAVAVVLASEVGRIAPLRPAVLDRGTEAAEGTAADLDPAAIEVVTFVLFSGEAFAVFSDALARA